MCVCLTNLILCRSPGYYMYIEASHMVYGQKAQLLSWPLRGVTGKQCLTFFYHMYGAGTGLLSVYLKREGESEESLLWRRRGEQSISWLRALIEYSCERQHQVSRRRQEPSDRKGSYKRLLFFLLATQENTLFFFRVIDEGSTCFRENIISLYWLNLSSEWEMKRAEKASGIYA